jgi:YggT family protein
MFVLGNLFITVGKVLNFLIGAYIWVIIIRALLSWFNPDPNSKLVRSVYDLTEPALRPLRNLLPFSSPLDISPILAIIILYFIRSFLVTSLIEFGYRIH